MWTPHRPARPAKSEGGITIRMQSDFEPAGDQPTAIADLVEGINSGERSQVLLGVTGSGKTFTMAKVIEATQRPAVILAPNKTLAAQLAGELKEFDPNCRAVVGVVAGGGRTDKPLAKAGKNYLTLRSRSVANKKTSGVAMNAVDHPNGGGSHPHVGGPNCHGRTAPPGQKAGFIAPKKKIKRK